MKLSNQELAYIADLLHGRVKVRAEAMPDFTGNDLIALKQKIDAELANRKGDAIPPNWRQQALEHAASKGIIVLASSKEIREAEARASKIEARRIAALDGEDLLGELGL